MRSVATSPVAHLATSGSPGGLHDAGFTFHVAPVPTHRSPTKSTGVQASFAAEGKGFGSAGGGKDGGAAGSRATQTPPQPSREEVPRRGDGVRGGRSASHGKVESWLDSPGVADSPGGARSRGDEGKPPARLKPTSANVGEAPPPRAAGSREPSLARQRQNHRGGRRQLPGSSSGEEAGAAPAPKRKPAPPKIAFGGRPPERTPSPSASTFGPAPKPAKPMEEIAPGPGAYYDPVEYDYFTAPPALLMAGLPASVFSMDDLDAAADRGAAGHPPPKPSEAVCGTYQPPPRKQVGPAFSFGVKTRQSQNATCAGPGRDSPGPAAYEAVDPRSKTAKAPSFGKPPKNGAGGGVWGSAGTNRPDDPGPGEYYEAESAAWGPTGKTGPSFSFGGGKIEGGNEGSRTGRGRGSDADAGPGPGHYHRDSDDDDPGDRAGGRAPRGFSFGGRVGKAWDALVSCSDSPGPGAYYEDVLQLGKGVADKSKGGAGTAPAFSFGTGPRYADQSTRGASEISPGPGEYAADDVSSGVSTSGSGVAGGNTGGTSVQGYTFGYRRPARDTQASSGHLGTGVGPGHYHRDPTDEDPGMLREGPAFTMGARLFRGGAACTAPDASEMPGPGEYDVDTRASGPAFTIVGRAKSCGKRSAEEAVEPGPGHYDTPASAAAPAFTMAGRPLGADSAAREAEAAPGPGEYGAPMPVGAELGGGGGAGHRTTPGFSITGREAWAYPPPGGGGGGQGGDTPGPADYLTNATARPLPAAPAYTMAGRTKAVGESTTSLADAPGPGEYATESYVGGSGGPSFTFGHRREGAAGGALGDPSGSGAVPGPGAYDVLDPEVAAEGKARRGYTMGGRVKHPSEVGTGEGWDTPGPGEYHAEGDGWAGGRGPSVTMAGRTAPAGAAAAVWFPGGDSPGPAAYAAVEPRASGAAFSFGIKTEPGGAFGVTRSTPGPGAYDVTPVAGEDGELVEGAPAFTFGVRGSFGAPDKAGGGVDGPGPGGAGDGGGGAKPPRRAPEFSFGVRTAGGGWGSAIGNNGDDPSGGPGEYNPDQSQSRTESGGFTMGYRRETTLGGHSGLPDAVGPGAYDLAEVEALQARGAAPGGVLKPGVKFPMGKRGEAATTDSPGPAYFTRPIADIGLGGPKGPKGFSIGTAERPEFATEGGGAEVPGVGKYDVERASRAMEGGGSKVVRGVTMAGRHELAHGSADFDAPIQYGNGMAPTAAMGENCKTQGVTLTGRDAWEREKALEKKPDIPGPQDYAPPPGATLTRAPEFSMGVRNSAEAARAAAEAAELPAPGDYDAYVRDAIGGQPDRGITIGVKRGEKREGSDGPAPGEYEPDEDPGANKRWGPCAVDIGRVTGRDAIGGVFDAAIRFGGDIPGPGDFWPDDMDEEEAARRENAHPPRGVHFGKPPPKPKTGGAAKDYHTPGPGDYEPDAAPPRPRTRAGLPGPTIPGARKASAFASDPTIPGPGEHEAPYHPKTIAGAAREAARRPGGMRPPPAPRTQFGTVFKPPPAPPTPGPGHYAPEVPQVSSENEGKGKGVAFGKPPAKKPSVSNTPGPGTYVPSIRGVSKGLTVGVKKPELGDYDSGPDYPDSFRSGGKLKGVRFA